MYTLKERLLALASEWESDASRFENVEAKKAAAADDGTDAGWWVFLAGEYRIHAEELRKVIVGLTAREARGKEGGQGDG